MKRYGYIYKEICDIENIKEAILKASKGKRNRGNVQKVLKDIDYYAEQIQSMLVNKTYVPSPYLEDKIKETASSKERNIFKPKYYPDQIIHWALMLKLSPTIMKGMYHYNCGSIPNRGIHYAHDAVKKWLKNDRKNTRYCVKIDISKFYPNVDTEILKALFRKRIKDKDTLWLIDSIIFSHDKGLPIGNYTSQWFSNFYLQWFDHFVKERLGIKFYVRYMDDCCFFGNNKKKLHKARSEIQAYLKNELHLTVKGNWQLFKIDSRGVDFVGYRTFRNYSLLRKKTALRVSRRARKVKKGLNITGKDASAIISYNGWLNHCNSHNFKVKHIYPLNINKLKRVIRHESKKRHYAS
jgi:hypothetical protein